MFLFSLYYYYYYQTYNIFSIPGLANYTSSMVLLVLSSKVVKAMAKLQSLVSHLSLSTSRSP